MSDMSNNEEWKWIPEYEGIYEISNIGMVRSYQRSGKTKIIKIRIWKGQPQVTLCKDNEKVNVYIDNLVKELFGIDLSLEHFKLLIEFIKETTMQEDSTKSNNNVCIVEQTNGSDSFIRNYQDKSKKNQVIDIKDLIKELRDSENYDIIGYKDGQSSKIPVKLVAIRFHDHGFTSKWTYNEREEKVSLCSFDKSEQMNERFRPIESLTRREILTELIANFIVTRKLEKHFKKYFN